MAETFPFDLRATRFGVVSGKTFGREGGMVVNSQGVEPYWSGTFTTPPLTREERIEALALLDDWVDMNRRVDFIHPSHEYPIGYDSDSWGMIGDASLVSVTNLRTIVVSGLQVSDVLRAGSRLCLIQDDVVCYRKITSTVIVSSAISQSLSIGPRLPPGIFAAAATVRLARSYARLMVVPESWDPDETIDNDELSWEMMETLR